MLMNLYGTCKDKDAIYQILVFRKDGSSSRNFSTTIEGERSEVIQNKDLQQKSFIELLPIFTEEENACIKDFLFEVAKKKLGCTSFKKITIERQIEQVNTNLPFCDQVAFTSLITLFPNRE